MEDKYFVFIDGEQKGPYSLGELISAGVRPSTYVWSKGMADWQRADEVPDVCRLFRQHLASKMHPTAEPQIFNPSATGSKTSSEPSSRPEAGEEPDLSDIPQSYRGFVRKSGTTPGPSNDMTPDTSQPPRVSMALAILSMLLCFVPTGLIAIFFTYRSLKTWNDAAKQTGETAETLRKQSHEFARLARMWVGLTVAFGFIFMGFIVSQYMPK